MVTGGYVQMHSALLHHSQPLLHADVTYISTWVASWLEV